MILYGLKYSFPIDFELINALSVYFTTCKLSIVKLKFKTLIVSIIDISSRVKFLFKVIEVLFIISLFSAI